MNEDFNRYYVFMYGNMPNGGMGDCIEKCKSEKEAYDLIQKLIPTTSTIKIWDVMQEEFIYEV